MWIDAHCHASEALLATHARLQIQGILSSDSKAQWQANLAASRANPNLTVSYGIHPWQSADTTLSAHLPQLTQAKIIGEIGLDHAWTPIPLRKQLPLFKAQLGLAQAAGKPVILHTKDAEGLVAALLPHYQNRYLIHWYASTKHLTKLIALGCYFTIGPDVFSDVAVQAVAKRVPANRLLMESDGIESMTWALHRPITEANFEAAYAAQYQKVATLRQLAVSQLEHQIEVNYHRFLSGID